VHEGRVTVETFVENFELVDKVGEANVPGEGHIVYYFDVTPPIKQDEQATTAEGTYAISTELSHTWNDVGVGPHVFWVQLVNNDNTPLEPASAVRVPVTAISNR